MLRPSEGTMRRMASCLAPVTLAAIAIACGSSSSSSFDGKKDGGSSSGSSSGGSSGSSSGSILGGDSGMPGDGGHPMPTMPVSIDECPGTLPGSTVSALQAGGMVDPAMKWLYPYDQTVFPGGLIAPVLQWTPQAAGTPTGVYLHMSSQLFAYKGCFGPPNPADL